MVAVEVQVAPLQADSLGDTQAGAGDQLHEQRIRRGHEHQQGSKLRAIKRANVFGVLIADLLTRRQSEPVGGVVA